MATQEELLERIANAVAFSPDGRLLALSTWGKGEVWEVDALLASKAP